jgi:catechol 2,3-dioxygenase-like lactoylglutathione lyase family enzyme
VLYAKDLDRVVPFYASVLGLQAVARDEEHVRLEARAFQLVVLRMAPDIAATIRITVPPARRANAAIKLMFVVPSIAAVRHLAAAQGGMLNGPESEWVFDGYRVCDGLDPEGNVIQFRERAG